jgi:hypothetical protein
MRQMLSRDRWNAVMNFQPVDRLPILEWAGWWDQTIARWTREGLPAGLSLMESHRHLGLDLHNQSWFPMTTHPDALIPAYHGGPIITSLDDYLKLRPLLYPDNIVDPADWAQRFVLQSAQDVLIWFTFSGFFWWPRTLLGIEPHLFAFYDQPELLHAINQDLANFMIRTLAKLSPLGTPDFMTFGEDFSYNHGPMLSEAQFDEFLLPYYRQIIPRLKEKGIWVIIDSDGDISRAIPWMQRAGFDGVLPLERQAGVDVAQIRNNYPSFRIVGGFDKMVMDKGEQALRKEFERLIPVAKKGGFVISVDHQTPPAVSYRNYQLYLKLFREYASFSKD